MNTSLINNFSQNNNNDKDLSSQNNIILEIIDFNSINQSINNHRDNSISSFSKKQEKNEILGFLLVLLCNFLRAMNALLMKFIEKKYSLYFESVSFLAIRAIMIIFLAWLYSYLTNNKILKFSEIDCKIYFLLRTNLNYFSVLFFTISIWYLRVSTVQIIGSLTPIIVTFLSVIILKEKFYNRYLIGMIICIIGSLFIINNEKKDINEISHNKKDIIKNTTNKFTFGMIIGIIFAFCNVTLASIVNLANKVLVNHKIHVSTQLLYLGSFTFIYSTLWIIHNWRLKICFGYVILSFLQGILNFSANVLFNFGIQRIDLSKASPISYTKVVFVLLLGGIFLGEKVYLTDFIGSGLIISYFLYNIKYPLIKKIK